MYALHVRVIEADDIPRMDANATDAYCILQTSSESQTTFAMRNSMHPRWNQDFHFNVTTPTIGSLHIIMRDKDIFKDDTISSIDIQFCSLPVGQVIDQWYCMIPYRNRKGGRLHLLLHMAPPNSPPFVPSVPVYPGYAAPGYPQPAVYTTPVYPAAPAYAAPGYPAPGYAAPGYAMPPPYPGYPRYPGY